jgi:hypothetical protein
MKKSVLSVIFLLGCGAPIDGGTRLVVVNTTAEPVTALLTLGAESCVSNVTKLPWKIKPMGKLKGTFVIGPGVGVEYSSGKDCSFIGNITFGKSFSVNPGCGSSVYPNATNIAEFTLNTVGETVDISAVNGVNASLKYTLAGGADWLSNDESVDPIRTISNRGMGQNMDIPGVFGWAADNCTESGDPPNPKPNCKAPLDAKSPEVSKKARCNVQRTASSPVGGTVLLAFKGFI